MSVRGYFNSSVSFNSIIQESEPTTKPALTKVACTLGPCSRDTVTLEKMLEAGMAVTSTCARIPMSWGTKAYHNETVENLQRAVRHTKILCGIMLDTKGTEMHIYNKSGGTLEIRKGQTIVLTCNKDVIASSIHLPVSLESFEGIDLKPGTNVFVGQYLFTGSETTSAYLTVTKVHDAKNVSCVATMTASLAGLDFVLSFSGLPSPLPVLCAKDVDALKTFGKSVKVHFISLSLCRSDEDVLECRKLLNEIGLTSTKILAKIETSLGLKNFQKILKVADGIVLSRGYLGLEIAPEKMFRVQKFVIDACNKQCKPIIVTRVMDTMTDNPRPTRAEATDIANLVLDGVDCLLLGAETFRGDHPVTTVEVTSAICRQAEESFDSERFFRHRTDEAEKNESSDQGHLESLGASAVRAASNLKADLIIVFTVSGRAARILSKYRPPVPVLAVVFPKLQSTGLKWKFSGESEARHLLVCRNCIPILADPSLGGTVESEAAQIEGSMLNRAIAYGYSKKWIKLGSRIVVSQHAGFNTDWSFQESGIVKVLSVDDEVLDAAIDTYNAHSESVQDLNRLFAKHHRRNTFHGVPINEMPKSIPLRSQHIFAPIQDSGDGIDEDDEIYNLSALPPTPEQSSALNLKQVYSEHPSLNN
eukprot:g1382.t1